MPTPSSNLVPTSIQRIRAFLNDACGMKVRPWAGVEETLDALHAVLLARRDFPLFWKSLHALLGRLAQDLRWREDAASGQLIDNEVLNAGQYASLMEEIRAALAQGRSSRGAFASLAGAVSMPAAALLLLLGGIVTVGCANHDPMSAARHDAGQAATARADVSPAPAEDAGPAPPADARPAGGADAGPASPTKPDSSGSPSEADSAGPVVSSTPDAATAQDSLSRGCDGGCSIEDILVTCGMSPAARQSASACIARLQDSWREQLTAAFASRSCDEINTILYCLPNYCQPGSVSQDAFDPKVLDCWIPPIYPIYNGIRFN